MTDRDRLADRPAPPGGVAQLRAALRRALWLGALAAAAGGVVVMTVGWFVAGTPGLLGGVGGTVLSALFLLVTAFVMWRSAGRDPAAVGAVVLLSWLVKVALAIATAALVRRLDGVDPAWFAIGMVVGMVVTLAAEYRSVTGARIPYVEPR